MRERAEDELITIPIFRAKQLVSVSQEDIGCKVGSTGVYTGNQKGEILNLKVSWLCA